MGCFLSYDENFVKKPIGFFPNFTAKFQMHILKETHYDREEDREKGIRCHAGGSL